MRNKHYEFIVAWASGAKIQWKKDLQDWRDIDNPAWVNNYEYRIKPELKEDIQMFVCVTNGYISRMSETKFSSDNLVLIIDGETGELKDAKVIK